MAFALALPVKAVREITIDHIEQAGKTTAAGGNLVVGYPATFYMRFTNQPGDGSTVTGVTNAFEIYCVKNGVWVDKPLIDFFETKWDSSQFN